MYSKLKHISLGFSNTAKSEVIMLLKLVVSLPSTFYNTNTHTHTLTHMYVCVCIYDFKQYVAWFYEFVYICVGNIFLQVAF